MRTDCSGFRSLSFLAALAPFLAACASDRPAAVEPASAAVTAGVSTQSLIGSWGVGAYHRDEDRARTEREARAQCRNPYVIKAGSAGGVMMHLADEKDPFELIVTTRNGRAILGPDNAPDAYNDREIIAFDPNSFTTKWLDPDIASRYGTTVYVRCGASTAPRRG
ncbi:MAG: hypothetical protein BGP06_13615 [Rhizobiales bacterium 65-9]|nr:hypothetical protein [Hyphomicrobiales bacterium]OJY36733.1 MAG: hypothetical protein BGP06_13615 [Rhizobiales bacterium 65-9]